MDPFNPKESTEESFKLMCLLLVNYGLLKHPLSQLLLALLLYGPWPLCFQSPLDHGVLFLFFFFCFAYFIVR
ncbi:hypothetical protein N7537_010753 [Penicillium hordei]|uniref:Uncharacterized protein n=1 Tax=Penicillium hordei TaxID=40994 RepID=A0AAD6GTC5_9EURO|nr:uncharacterized protein N7537_010753 [Penicillium hordei]KAJ5588075.1 hypothetical protein N7537_010753 [Penicillium hordei]